MFIRKLISLLFFRRKYPKYVVQRGSIPDYWFTTTTPKPKFWSKK